MQGFLYTVDPNQGKSGFATFIVHIYGTAINNLRLSLCEARCTEGNPKTQSWKSKLQHEVRLNIRGLSTPNKHFCKSRHEWLSTCRSSWQHQGVQPTHFWKSPCNQKNKLFSRWLTEFPPPWHALLFHKRVRLPHSWFKSLNFHVRVLISGLDWDIIQGCFQFDLSCIYMTVFVHVIMYECGFQHF